MKLHLDHMLDAHDEERNSTEIQLAIVVICNIHLFIDDGWNKSQKRINFLLSGCHSDKPIHKCP